MNETVFKVYVSTDDRGRIIRCEGGYTTPADLTGWTLIDEGTGDRYNLCQSHYFDGGLYTDDGIPRYKLQDGKAAERTEEEIQADRAAVPAPPPGDTEVLDTLLGGEEDRPRAAEQLRRALQMFAVTLPEEQAVEIATLYQEWEADRYYAAGEILRYGANSVGDPQLYRTVQAHTSAEEWKPDQSPALYEALGLDDEGYPIWSQPSGAHDAYNAGDIVSYQGTLYRSNIDGNTTVPGSDPRWWEVYN